MKTVSLSFHCWRGFGLDRQLFMAFVVIGFITVGVSRQVLQDTLAKLRDQLKAIKSDDHVGKDGE